VIRLAWRQFRTEASIGVGALVVVAVVLAVTGPHLIAVYRTAPNQLSSTDHGLQVAVPVLLLLTPALVGLFFGAPVVARELETGTYRLAWTQSVTRLRWMVVKFALLGLAGSVLAGGLSLMAAWWANPIDITNQNRFTPSLFGILGIVPFGYGLFAFALGATTGLVFRKTLPAMATTLVGFTGTRLAVTYWARPHFEAPLRLSEPLGPGMGFGFFSTSSGLSVTVGPPSIANAWPLTAEIVDKAGSAPTSAFLSKVCPGLAGPNQPIGRIAGGAHTRPVAGGSMHSCIANLASKFHAVITYQPASRYWPFQIYETALFVLLALALAGLSLWWVRRRLT
jgi:hypothetical protein